MPIHYIFLFLAVVAETIGTSALQASQQFTRLWPTLLMLVSYTLAFYLLTYPLKIMPVGIVYAIWSGLGIVCIALFGWILFRQSLDWPAIAGLALIVGGIVIIQVFSDATPH